MCQDADQLLLGVYLVLLNHGLHILERVEPIGKSLVEEIDNAQHEICLLLILPVVYA